MEQAQDCWFGALGWDCRKLLRDDTFDIGFNYEADANQKASLTGVRNLGSELTCVEGESAPDRLPLGIAGDGTASVSLSASNHRLVDEVVGRPGVVGDAVVVLEVL